MAIGNFPIIRRKPTIKLMGGFSRNNSNFQPTTQTKFKLFKYTFTLVNDKRRKSNLNCYRDRHRQVFPLPQLKNVTFYGHFRIFFLLKNRSAILSDFLAWSDYVIFHSLETKGFATRKSVNFPNVNQKQT